jgi:hemolysin III
LSLAIAVYAACLIVMLACSAVYNLTRPSAARRVLRRLDEAAIFLMIAGSYTPFVITLLDRPWDIAAALFVWVLAFAGVLGKLFVTHLSDRFWCYAYVAFGWLAVLILGPAVTGLPMIAAVLIAAGGLVYSAGVLFFLRENLPFRRAIWHGFVVVGATLHFGAVAALIN